MPAGYGGQNSSGLLAQTYIYFISSKTWTILYPGGTDPFGRCDFDMAYIGGDKVMLFGGYTSAGQNDTWLYER